MQSKKNVSIILLNYNGKMFNKDCINSILSQTYQDFEIIFVDNNSSDNSLQEIEKLYQKEIDEKKIKIIKNKENYYFAEGNNIWVRNSSDECKYIRLLNNDTILDRKCLEELIIWIESDKDLWGVSSLILDKWYEDKINEKTIKKWEIRTTNIFWQQVWKKIPIQERKKGIYYTSFLCWCSILYKKNLVKEPFLEFYKIYAEDLQLSREILLKWYTLAICKNSKLFHLWSATMKRAPYLKLYLTYRNIMIDYFYFNNFFIKLRLFPIFILFTITQILFSGNILLATKAKIQWYLWIIKNKKKILELKKRIKRSKKIKYKSFVSYMSRKFADDDLNSSPLKIKIINIVNFIIKIYYIIMFIPYKK